jgi:hypothetical protein
MAWLKVKSIKAQVVGQDMGQYEENGISQQNDPEIDTGAQFPQPHDMFIDYEQEQRLDFFSDSVRHQDSPVDLVFGTQLARIFLTQLKVDYPVIGGLSWIGCAFPGLALL